MSTNIRIDVTLQRLQEVAKETTEKNREEKKAREEDLALEAKAAELSVERDGSVPPIEDLVDSLGQPLSRTGEPPSEKQKQKQKQKQNEADKSSVPDLYKKLDPGAGAASLFKPMFCGYRETDGGTNTSEIKVDHEFFLSSGQKAVIKKTRPNVIGRFDFVSTEDIEGNVLSNFRGTSSTFTEGRVVLPLGGGNFMFCYFIKERARVKQAIVTGALSVTGDAASVDVTGRDGESEYYLCVLVSANSIKEVAMPSFLKSVLLDLYPLPAIENYTIGVFTRPLADNYPGGVPFLDLEWDWLFFVVEPLKSYEDEAVLYGHYLDSILSVQSLTGGPAIYWWLSNPANRDLSSLAGAQIRSLYPGANYGVNPGGRWYTPYSLADQQNDFNSSGIFGASLTRPGSFKPNFTSLPDQRVFAVPEQEKRQRIAGPYRNGQLQIDEGIRVNFVLAWDGNVGGYCNASALQLGFRPSDLTFGESVDE